MTDKNTSTLQSYVDSATATVQGIVGNLTGSVGDQNEANQKKTEAEAKNDLSHAAVKAGPFTATAGGVAKDSPDRTDGSWNQTVGSAKEAVGGLIGAEGLKQAGQQQNREGKEQEARGQLSDLGTGVGDRVSGAVGGALAGLTGNREDQLKYEQQHDQGKTLQRGVEADLQKQDPHPQ